MHIQNQYTSQFFHNLVDNLNDAFIATDSDVKIVQWNKAAEKIYGWLEKEVLGKPVSEILRTEYLNTSRDDTLQIITEKGVWSGEVIQTKKDGEKISIHSKVSRVLDDNGNNIGLVALNRDITETKHAEERFRLAVESAPNAIVMVNQQGDIVLVNSQVEKYFGYKRGELINQSVNVLVPQRFSKVHPGHREGFMSNPQMRSMGVGRDLFALRKDGSEFPVEIGLAPINTDEGTFVLATIVDITERTQADERFRLAVESAPNAIIMVDQNGAIELVNSQVEKYFGYSRNELIGISVDRLVPDRFKDLHPNHRALFISDPLMRPMGMGRDLYALRKNGSEFPVEIGLVPIQTNTGIYVLVTIVDITSRKQAEDETKRLNQELESFAYTVSHDLRAPLRGIDGFANILATKYTEILDENGRHYLQRIQVNTRRMAQMIEDLLNLAKMTRQKLKYSRVDISAIIQEIKDDIFINEPPERKVQLEVEQHVEAWCDAGLIRIALQNLLSNAWKFTAKEPETIIQFRASVMKSNGRTVFELRDNGIGFDMAHAQKLFSAFHRLHASEEFAGTGIGLATVQRIINRHGGSIWAESAPGKGASFYFTLGGFNER